MQQVRYLEKLVEQCSDQRFGQDAVQWAVMMDLVTISWTDIEADARLLMAQYDAICDAYQNDCRRNQALLAEAYRDSGLLEEILRPIPLAA